MFCGAFAYSFWLIANLLKRMPRNDYSLPG